MGLILNSACECAGSMVHVIVEAVCVVAFVMLIFPLDSYELSAAAATTFNAVQRERYLFRYTAFMT